MHACIHTYIHTYIRCLGAQATGIRGSDRYAVGGPMGAETSFAWMFNGV